MIESKLYDRYKIISLISDRFDIHNPYEKTNKPPYPMCRAFIYYFLRKINVDRYSYPLLGRMFGKHHTTVMFGVAKIEQYVNNDPNYKHMAIEICEVLRDNESISQFIYQRIAKELEAIPEKELVYL